MIYDQIEPISNSFRIEFMIARLCSVVVNCMRSVFTKKGSKVDPTNAIDFVPSWWKVKPKKEAKKVQTVEEQKSILYTIANVFGKKNKSKGK